MKGKHRSWESVSTQPPGYYVCACAYPGTFSPPSLGEKKAIPSSIHCPFLITASSLPFWSVFLKRVMCPPNSTLTSCSAFDSLESVFQAFFFYFFFILTSFAKIPSDLLTLTYLPDLSWLPDILPSLHCHSPAVLPSLHLFDTIWQDSVLGVVRSSHLFPPSLSRLLPIP